MKSYITICITICITSLLLTACATTSTKYEWKPAPEKTVAETQVEMTGCLRASEWASTEIGKAQYFNKCMRAHGHTLVEMKD
jgi:PBP1b-binding outer membrane lipoprotein LpoB